MKIRREHFASEAEVRWREGVIWLERTRFTAGYWQQEDSKVNHGTLSVPVTEARLPSWAIELGNKILSNEFPNVRIAMNQETRVINKSRSKPAKRISNSLYFEVQNSEGVWSFATSIDPQSPRAVARWFKNLKGFLSLPIYSGDLNIEQVVFSPASFGYVLHECLGHRLESDDYKTVYTWPGNWKRINFDVWDTPGKSKFLAFIPFDDLGVKGSSIRLINGDNGKQKFLTRGSGNSRATTHDHHALIRQRCLEVIMKSPKQVPSKGTKLFVDDIECGSVLNSNVELISNMQRVQGEDGKFYRLPALRLKMNPTMVIHLHAFGKKEMYSPAGGCGKNGQTNLPVSFFAPSAWCSTKAPLKIEVR